MVSLGLHYSLYVLVSVEIPLRKECFLPRRPLLSLVPVGTIGADGQWFLILCAAGASGSGDGSMGRELPGSARWGGTGCGVCCTGTGQAALVLQVLRPCALLFVLSAFFIRLLDIIIFVD